MMKSRGQLAGTTRLDLPLLLGTIVTEDPDKARVAGFFVPFADILLNLHPQASPDALGPHFGAVRLFAGDRGADVRRRQQASM
jgi:hypothetical protein